MEASMQLRRLGRDGPELSVAERHGVSVAAVAVAWVIAQSGVTGAIVGVRRPSQVDGWLPAGDLCLGDYDLEEIPRGVVENGAGRG
jgi:aryl-alcohol dehydrogenase-like predicted oxidoreductase